MSSVPEIKSTIGASRPFVERATAYPVEATCGITLQNHATRIAL